MKVFTTTTKLLACILFTAALLLPISPRGEVQTVHAQFSGTGIIVNDIQNTLTNTIQTLSTVALEQKELVWDALFYEIAKKALQQMTNDIISWVNSGFDGNPAFITDLAGYLQNIADDVAGDFIYGDDLSSLCSPFQLDVRIAVAEGYQEKNYGGIEKQAECSIDDVGGDAGAFLSGDFNAGGWSMWFEAVLNPENTPIGGYAMVDLALQEEIDKKQSEKLREADWNQGFLSQEVCTPVEGGSSTDEKCTITTPGIIIKDQLSFALTTPARSLIEADEMNEVIGALFSNLAQQAFTGINGLLGLGGNASFSDNSFGASGGSSYLDAMQQESDQSGSASDITGNKIEQALRTETEVLDLEDQILKQLDDLASAYADAKEPFDTDSCWNLSFPSSLSSVVDDLVEKIPKTINTIIKLEDLSSRYDEAGSSQQQLSILQEFTSLQSSGEISGQTAVIQYEYYLNNELKDQVATFEEAIDDEVDACQ